MNDDVFPVADPRSFAAEPITASEIAETDLRQVAQVVNVYARVLTDHELHDEVAQVAAGRPE